MNPTLDENNVRLSEGNPAGSLVDQVALGCLIVSVLAAAGVFLSHLLTRA